MYFGNFKAIYQAVLCLMILSINVLATIIITTDIEQTFTQGRISPVEKMIF